MKYQPSDIIVVPSPLILGKHEIWCGCREWDSSQDRWVDRGDGGTFGLVTATAIAAYLRTTLNFPGVTDEA